MGINKTIVTANLIGLSKEDVQKQKYKISSELSKCKNTNRINKLKERIKIIDEHLLHFNAIKK